MPRPSAVDRPLLRGYSAACPFCTWIISEVRCSSLYPINLSLLEISSRGETVSMSHLTQFGMAKGFSFHPGGWSGLFQLWLSPVYLLAKRSRGQRRDERDPKHVHAVNFTDIIPGHICLFGAQPTWPASPTLSFVRLRNYPPSNRGCNPNLPNTHTSLQHQVPESTTGCPWRPAACMLDGSTTIWRSILRSQNPRARPARAQIPWWFSIMTLHSRRWPFSDALDRDP